MWRRYIAFALWQAFAYADVSEQVETWIGELLVDLYDSEVVGGMAVGVVVPMTVTTLPDNMLWCDGTQYNRVDYTDLYAVLEAAFIVDVDHFVTPDLTERFVYGKSSAGAVGDTGGEATHTLTTDEMPVHNHVIKRYRSYGGSFTHLGSAGAETGGTFYSEDAGGGLPHNNLPPYLMLKYAIVAK